MLVILNGVETIHKKFFARKILAALNTFTVDGYTVDFSVEPFKVTDSNGKVVYCGAQGNQPAINELLIDLDNDGVIDPEGNATFDKILELYNTLFLDGGRHNHFYSVFIDLLYDYQITDTLSYSGLRNPEAPTLRHPHSYADILENYNNRLGTTHVITGIFSKGFINAIKNDLGAGNVTVLNIIRNPSVCALIHQKSSDYYANPEKDITLEVDEQKLKQSLANAAVLTKLPDVVTLRFEDIIRDGRFIVNGVEVAVPAGYDRFNEYLTLWENTNAVSLGLISSETLDAMNIELQHDASGKSSRLTEDDATYINSLRTNPLTLAELKTLVTTNMPENLFDVLEYTPLTHEDIVE